MSSAEWNVLGLTLNLIGLLLLFRYGWPKLPARTGWLGVALLIAGTLCQVWASVRWVG
jgi:hypothetical protein